MGLINDDVNHTGDATLLRKVNESAVLELIRRCGSVTRSDLARRLHLSLSTIARIANELLNASLIVEASSAGSSGGRRPGLFESGLGMDAAVLGAVAIATSETSDSLFVQPSRA